MWLGREPYGRNRGLSRIEWFRLPNPKFLPPPPPTPPRLISPIGGVLVATQAPVLLWMQSHPEVPGLVYRVTVKVRRRGQSVIEAMLLNPARLQVDVPTTGYIPLGQQLGRDAAALDYAGRVWQVQVLLNGQPYGDNNGLGQVEWFKVPATVEGDAPPTPQLPETVVWEVDYL